jgi:hypothetical protein
VLLANVPTFIRTTRRRQTTTKMDVDDAAVVDLAEANAWFDEVDVDHHADEAGEAAAAPAAATKCKPLRAANDHDDDDEQCGEPEVTHDDDHHRRADRADATDASKSPRPKKKLKTGDPSAPSQSSASLTPPPKKPAAVSVPWESMFERLVAYKDKFGVRCFFVSFPCATVPLFNLSTTQTNRI